MNTLTSEKFLEISKSMDQLSRLVSKDIGWTIRLNIELKTNHYAENCFEITSDPLPESFFGILSKVIISIIIESWGNIINKDGHIVFNPYLYYRRYNGGSNSSAICDSFGHPYHYWYINKNEGWKRIYIKI